MSMNYGGRDRSASSCKPKRKWRYQIWRGQLMLVALLGLKAISRFRFLRRRYQALLMRLVRSTGLFDAEYYRDDNPDVVQAELSPLRHYVVYGDREGRQPMPFFNPSYYRAHVPGRQRSINTLLHYAWVGRFIGVAPSPWFDTGYYLAHNKDVARAGIDPLRHYLCWGGLEGRSPCAQFDGAHYLNDNPDVLAARINPLLHYLRFGRYEGRSAFPVPVDIDKVEAEPADLPLPATPDEKSWEGLCPRKGGDSAGIDVIVPVYKGRVETLHCLQSVLAAVSATSFELVVIDDATPDAELAADLRRLERQGFFTLLVNPHNRGFVFSVNRGMALHPERDVVLLNADTEVYDGWLDRLRQAARRHPRTGTVTPLSNNATICSYPRFLHDNPYPLELGYDRLDALTATVNGGIEVETPTAVGFCTYIKRACLDEVGLFDEANFGRGYGEENDFCQRAILKGWRNVIAADIFVHHWGSTSFRGEKIRRIQNALHTLGKLHPRYQRDVDDFIRRDPLQEARRRLDYARLQSLRKHRNVLIVCHNRGGGAERHVQEDITRLTQEGFGVFLLRPRAGNPAHVVLGHPTARFLPNRLSIALADTATLKSLLQDLNITEIHTHSLVDFSSQAPDHLLALARELGTHLEVNLHDYEVVCPRINLIDRNGLYCSEPSEAGCRQCLLRNGSDSATVDIRGWRTMYHRLLQAAARVLVPDQDVADRLTRYFPDVTFTISPHEELAPTTIQMRPPVLGTEEVLRIVVVGAIGKIKGFEVLLQCARDARQRRLPLEFIVMGYSMNDALLQAAGVRITGRYLEENAQDLLAKLQPHVAWLPSLWPETYSYTLSIVLQYGLPVFAFDIGAIARRLREFGRDDHLMPLEMAADPGAINQRFENFKKQGHAHRSAI